MFQPSTTLFTNMSTCYPPLLQKNRLNKLYKGNLLFKHLEKGVRYETPIVIRATKPRTMKTFVLGPLRKALPRYIDGTFNNIDQILFKHRGKVYQMWGRRGAFSGKPTSKGELVVRQVKEKELPGKEKGYETTCFQVTFQKKGRKITFIEDLDGKPEPSAGSGAAAFEASSSSDADTVAPSSFFACQ